LSPVRVGGTRERERQENEQRDEGASLACRTFMGDGALKHDSAVVARRGLTQRLAARGRL
jgi:hypothetical protein